MATANESFDYVLAGYIEGIEHLDLGADEAKTIMQNLRTFTECRPPMPEPEPTPEPVPTTVWEKTKAGASAVWDNETTRVLLKAGGAFAGVAVVAYSTIKRDHVIERQAFAQANQRPT